MTESTPPPRRPLATFLRASSGGASESDAASSKQHPEADRESDTGSDTVPVTEPDNDDTPDNREDIASPEAGNEPVLPEANADIAAPADASDAAFKRLAEHPAPSFMRAPATPLPTPRWQWGLVAGLVVVLALQITVADRARLAADAGSRPWIAGLCSVLRCSLPAWREPTAFSMISRDVRPVTDQPGALQVQASFRNDARWAQGWPSLRLSLSDADGRVIGTSVFAPHDYLDPSAGSAEVLEPGQSAQIAFRVREPAASTVAFTFEFL